VDICRDSFDSFASLCVVVLSHCYVSFFYLVLCRSSKYSAVILLSRSRITALFVFASFLVHLLLCRLVDHLHITVNTINHDQYENGDQYENTDSDSIDSY
jgi:hypothetical protein